MNFNEYQKLAMRTARELNIVEFALGISGEAGEVTDLIKKVEFHGHEMNKIKLVDELGDVLWYLALLAETIGVELEEVAKVNIDKLKERYPDGFESERSINRTTIRTTAVIAARLCSVCKHYDCELAHEPCKSCITRKNRPNWRAKDD